MTDNVTKNTCVVDAILDAIEEVAFKLRLLTDDQLACLVTNLVSEGTDKVYAVVKFAEQHGGPLLAVRVAKVVKAHGPYGSKSLLWNRAIGNRIVLVEGSNA
ncbi:MAG: hypothetical protein J7530_01315 [Novosphingobium sp.]|nr:hypothetical protein [Novosphingobium sp.]